MPGVDINDMKHHFIDVEPRAALKEEMEDRPNACLVFANSLCLFAIRDSLCLCGTCECETGLWASERKPLLCAHLDGKDAVLS